MERREDFKFRFLDVKDSFWDYVEKGSSSPSEVIRHFIKQGVSNDNFFTINQHKEMIEELSKLRKLHGSIGTNLNQTARYFNKFDHLLESDLHKNHQEILDNQKAITKLLNQILMKM